MGRPIRDIGAKTRRCCVCKVTKPLTKEYFNANKYGGRGFLYNCRSCGAAHCKDYRRRKKSTGELARQKLKDRERRRKRRLHVLRHYGNRCACCGEDAYEFLAIDHINNDGGTFRAAHGNKLGDKMYIWIIRNNYPTDLQLLCHNCNLAKAFYGICPHKR
jgi:hypothetical protein